MLWHLIFIIIFFAFGIESGKIRPNFDEIFGNECDKNESEENREEMGTESMDQMQNDQNIIKNDQKIKEQLNDQQKREMIQKFEAINEKLKQKGKYQWKNGTKIERKIGKLLGTYREKIYKWKKEMNLNKIEFKRMKDSFYNEKKKEFFERFDDFKRLCKGKQKEFTKELGISEKAFRRWKKELVPKYYKTCKRHSDEEKLKKLKQYFNQRKKSKVSDGIIAKQLKIGYETLRKWKKKFASVS